MRFKHPFFSLQLLSQNKTPMVIAANSSAYEFFKISTDPDVKKAYSTAKRMDTIIDLYSYFDSEGFRAKFQRLLDEGKAVFTGNR